MLYDPLNVYRGKYKEFIESVVRGRPMNEHFDYSERHHVIPFCCEGKDNDEDNIRLYLTYREHFIAHKILHEENPDNHKLLSAYWRMCNGKTKVATPEEYEEARMNWSNNLRVSMRDSGNPNYNTHVMNNGFSQIHVSPEDIEEYKCLGYSLGALPKSEETREKLSISLKGHGVTDETRENLSSSQLRYLETHDHQRKGTKHRAESIAIIAQKASMRNKGEGNPMYGKRGKDNPNYGRIKSEEERKGISIRMKGNKSNTGKVCINDGYKNKFVFIDNLDDYLSLGYKRGRI